MLPSNLNSSDQTKSGPQSELIYTKREIHKFELIDLIDLSLLLNPLSPSLPICQSHDIKLTLSLPPSTNATRPANSSANSSEAGGRVPSLIVTLLMLMAELISR